MEEPDVTLELANYAHVHRFAMDPAAIRAGLLSGYAAPADGAKGCALKLSTGGEIFAVAKAWTYSEAALVDGVQDGWAGFCIHGLSTAMAMGPPIELRCAVSGSLLVSLERTDMPAEAEAPPRPFLTATGLQIAIRSFYGCSDTRHMVAFAERFRSQRGDAALVQASYSWLLRRPCDDSERRNFTADIKPDWGVAEIWDKFLSSDEFRNGRGLPLLGLHEPGFPFPRS